MATHTQGPELNRQSICTFEFQCKFKEQAGTRERDLMFFLKKTIYQVQGKHSDVFLIYRWYYLSRQSQIFSRQFIWCSMYKASKIGRGNEPHPDTTI
jgi:hypothetical protein